MNRVGEAGRIWGTRMGDHLLTKEVGWSSSHRFACKSMDATHDVPIDIMS